MLSNRSKSILLQVAFKAAVDNTAPDTDFAKLEELSALYFESLIALHEKYGISDQSDTATTSGGGGGSTPDAPAINISGEEYLDYRGLKNLGAVNAAFPDFKTPDGKKSVWLKKKDGSPTKFAVDHPELV